MSSDSLIVDPSEATLLGAEDFMFFCHTFFPKTFRQASPEFHADIGRRLYAQVRRNMFLVFRDGAKTTLLRAFVAQRMAYGISRTVMFTSASQGHSIHSIRWLKRAVERNPVFSSHFGLRPGSKWTDEWIQVINEVAEIEINVLAVGLTGQIRGFNLDDYRPDLIVADDILTEENTATLEQRTKTETIFIGGLENSLQAETEAPHAKIVLLQTPFNTADLSMKCARDPHWNPAVYGCFDENGESRWPAKFPTKLLKADKESAIMRGNKRLWMREKECKIVKSEEVTINSDHLQYWEQVPLNTIKFISIDPASSDSKKADNNVVMAIGVRGPDVFVLGYKATKATMPDQCAANFFDLALRFAPILRAGCEGVSYQRTLKWYIEREMAQRRIFVPMQLVQDMRRKADRILQHIPGLLAFGHLHIHPSMSDLISEMDDYNPAVQDNRDDILDALAMAIMLAGPILQSVYTIDGQIQVVGDESEYKQLELNGGAP